MKDESRIRIALTMGDVAGIGPEVIVRACTDKRLQKLVSPIVVGHPEILKRAISLVRANLEVREIRSLSDFRRLSETEITSEYLCCWNPGKNDLLEVLPGENDPRSGRAAYDYLIGAVRGALAGEIDGITTAPLSKQSLHLAGLNFPGHTEILAAECGVKQFGMMLYLPQGKLVRSPNGLGVVHVTLHTSIRKVPELILCGRVSEKIILIDEFMREMGCANPRIGVCALNPHGGEEGLFGEEESTTIEPGVSMARQRGIDARGPYPADTLLKRAVEGEYDAVVAMYHDQGHIALKLIAFESAVNVTLGLPIIRTSPSHGTAFDIAWQGRARGEGMVQAIRVAAERIAAKKRLHPER